MTFCAKLWLVQNFCILCLIRWIGLFRDYNGTKYLILFGSEHSIELDILYISLKISILYVASDNCAKIKPDWDDDLSLEKTLTLHNFVILFKSVFLENKNQYYHNVFLEKKLESIS